MADNITITQVTRTSVEPAALVTADGDDLSVPSNDGNVIIEVQNPTGGSLNVTLLPQATVAGISLSSQVIAIGAGKTLWLGPLPPAVYNLADGTAQLSADAGLKFRGLRI